MNEVSKYTLLDIAQAWQRWTCTTAREWLDRDADAPEDQAIRDVTERTRKMSEAQLNRLAGAVDMANTIFGQSVVYDTLEKFLGRELLDKTNLFGNCPPQ